jgi:hypothetical protein
MGELVNHRKHCKRAFVDLQAVTAVKKMADAKEETV